MNDFLQYGALGILAMMIGGGALFAQKMIAPLSAELIKVLPLIPPAASELKEQVNEIRVSLATLVERTDLSREAHERASIVLETIGADVRDVHQHLLGSNSGKNIGSRGR